MNEQVVSGILIILFFGGFGFLSSMMHILNWNEPPHYQWNGMRMEWYDPKELFWMSEALFIISLAGGAWLIYHGIVR